MVFRVPHNVFRQQKNVTAARLAGGKHIYINLTKLTELAETYRETYTLITPAVFVITNAVPVGFEGILGNLINRVVQLIFFG